MVATLTIATDDESAIAAVQGFQSALDAAQRSADELIDDVLGLNNAIDDEVADLNRLADQWEHNEQAARQFGDEASKAVQAAVPPDDSAAKWTEFNTRVIAVVEIFDKIIQYAPQAKQYIQDLADAGDRDMQRLNAAIDGVGTSLLTLVERATATKEGTSTAGWFAGLLEADARGIEALPSLFDSLEVAFTDSVRSMQASVGLLSEEERRAHTYFMNAYAEREAERARAIDDIEHERAVRESTHLVEKANADFAKARAIEREAEDIKRLNTLQQVEAELAKESDRLEEAKREGKASAELIEEVQRRRMLLMQREREVQQRLHDERVAQEREFEQVTQQVAEERQRLIEEEEQARRDALQREQDAQREFDEAVQRSHEERLRQQQQEFDKYIDQVAQQLDALAKKQNQGGNQGVDNLLGQLQNNLPQVAVAEQVRQNRAREFAQKQAEERRKLQERQAEETLRGQQDPNDNAGARIRRQREEQDLLQRQQARAERDFQRQQRSERLKEARGIGGTQASQEEIAKAQQELSDKVVDQAVQSGNLTEAQAQALRRAAEVAGQQAERQAAIQADVEQVQQQLDAILDGLTQDGQRARAQRVGRRR